MQCICILLWITKRKRSFTLYFLMIHSFSLLRTNDFISCSQKTSHEEIHDLFIPHPFIEILWVSYISARVFPSILHCEGDQCSDSSKFTNSHSPIVHTAVDKYIISFYVKKHKLSFILVSWNSNKNTRHSCTSSLFWQLIATFTWL